MDAWFPAGPQPSDHVTDPLAYEYFRRVEEPPKFGPYRSIKDLMAPAPTLDEIEALQHGQMLRDVGLGDRTEPLTPLELGNGHLSMEQTVEDHQSLGMRESGEELGLPSGQSFLLERHRSTWLAGIMQFEY
jgi:hypothetical protein